MALTMRPMLEVKRVVVFEYLPRNMSCCSCASEAVFRTAGVEKKAADAR